MPRWLRTLNWVAALLALVLIAGSVAAVWTVRRSLPQTEGTITVPGLSAPVTVIRDAYGVPQVYADTSADLFFAQGYVQSQDRFFEMDFRRHVTAGRLTELFGRDALKTDMFVRTLGWRRVAEAELPQLSTDTRRYLDAFAAGVNAYLSDHSGSELSLEYAALSLSGLDYTPEPWTPADSLAWLKAMAWDLGSNLDDEIDRSLESADLTRRQITELYPAYPYDENAPVVTQGAVVDGRFEQDATAAGTRLPSRPPYRLSLGAATAPLRDASRATASLDRLLGLGDGIGSNAWAVSGDHTASGAPILANDPHLEASMPSVWYQMGLHCNVVGPQCPFDVTGFTFAGLPGVVIGHNDAIAWGFTNLYADVQDLYLEAVRGGRYLYNGRYRALRTRQESFSIAGEDAPVTMAVRKSRHGPLLSGVSHSLLGVGDNAPAGSDAPERGHGYAVALRWTALEPGRTADALFGINVASNWDEFKAAARFFEVPSQNLVYADTAGHIGYQAPGHIPVRRAGDGRWPMPGWDPTYEWEDHYVPFEALPSVLDPEDGYIVTANQPVTDQGYPYFVGSAFDYGYRAQRIRDLLEAEDDLTVDDMASIQLDTFSGLAEDLTPLLLSVELPTTYYQAGQRALARWDFRQDADSAGAAYFNTVWSNLLSLTFNDDLPEHARPTGGSRWWAVMLVLLDDPRNSYWDNRNTFDVEETRDDVVLRALMDARDELTSRLSRDPHDWEWGRLHTLELRNASLGSEGSPVAFLFNRGAFELDGGPSVANATSWDARDDYQVTAVPSMRMVIPLDDLDGSRWINLTGASGHAYDDHYTDQTSLWVDGDTLPWVYSRSAVAAAGERMLTLRPSS